MLPPATWGGLSIDCPKFQWAPTLGGECYVPGEFTIYRPTRKWQFQWAPTLGGECYWCASALPAGVVSSRFNGHPPLGVNATFGRRKHIRRVREFQWAPTLGGECYAEGLSARRELAGVVSMGTHPWG